MNCLWTHWIFFTTLTTGVVLGKGMKCYDCAYNDDDIGTSFEANQLCKDADEKLLVSCEDDKSHCLKIAGLVNGKPGGLRQCAGANWWKLVKEEDKCIDSSSIPKLSVKLDSKSVKLDNGTVCVCSTESCNGKDMITPSLFQILTTCIVIILPNLK